MKLRALSTWAMAITLLAPGAAFAEPAAPVARAPTVSSSSSSTRPNVLVWMMDDVGFAQVSSFGGLVATPNIDRVARLGLRYSNYHTSPICSAARASFLTGRMPHSVNIGGHATAALSFPGYHAHIPASAGTLAANLKQAGYTTFAVGKWDHLPSEEASPAGPFRYWPSGQGFEKFYGFLAADTDNWNPVLIRDHAPVAKPSAADYHLSDDLADQAITMIQSRDVRDPARPFFLYWATGRFVVSAPAHTAASGNSASADCGMRRHGGARGYDADAVVYTHASGATGACGPLLPGAHRCFAARPPAAGKCGGGSRRVDAWLGRDCRVPAIQWTPRVWPASLASRRRAQQP